MSGMQSNGFQELFVEKLRWKGGGGEKIKAGENKKEKKNVLI